MKRCPQCNRVETDEALVYCRLDGTALVSDSGSVSGEAGTAKLGSLTDASEVHTSLLPHTTDIKHATATTTVLPVSAAATTGAIAKARRRKTAIRVVVTVIVTAGTLVDE